ncbi:MAG: TonB-dependent receptor [Pseudomonadota bacterium]
MPLMLGGHYPFLPKQVHRAIMAIVLVASLTALIAASNQVTAQTTERIEFDIPAGSLSDALNTLAQQAGVYFSGNGELTADKTSQGLEGSYTVSEALQRLLQGTELDFRFTSANSLTLLQQSGSGGPLRLAPIKVSGELIERDIQDSRTSAVVLDGEALERGVSMDFSEVLERTPGVTNTGGGISIRGIGESPNGISGERTINVQVDGATFGVSSRLNSTNFSTWDLEQVDILRGPQSTQTGRNALAGAIVLRSRDPEYFQEARVKLGYASFDTGQAAIALNTPLIDERLALRFSYDRTTSDGEISNPDPEIDNVDEEDRTSIRLGLRWDPTDQLSAVLKVSRLDIEEGSRSVDTATLPDFVTTADIQSRQDDELDAVNLQVTYDFSSEWSLVSSTSLSDFESFATADLDGTAAPSGASIFTGDSEWFEQEFNLNYRTDRTSAILGAYYYDENSELGAEVPGLAVGALIDDIQNYAIFGEFEHTFNNKWSAIVGFRYDVEEGTFEEINVFGGFEVASDFDFSFEAFLPKVGLIYALGQAKSIGLTYQRGYRAGGVGINRLGGTNEFDPEYTDNLEFSFRSEHYNGNLTVNANVFYTDWTDRQVRVLNPPFTIPDNNRIANLGSAERYGFELDFRAQATENLSLYGGFTYAEDESIFPRFDLAENVVSEADERTALFGGQYDSDKNWYVNGSINYTVPQQDTNERTLVDVQAGFRWDDWHAYLFATNLFDEDYTLNRGPIIAIRGMSRRVGIVLEAAF